MEKAHRLTGVTAILRRVLAYSDKVFHLQDLWREVRDFRPQPQIPTHVFPATIFLMFLCRLRSFNELEQYANQSSWPRWLRHAVPSVDEIAYVSQRMDLSTLREVLAHIYTRLMRNKVLKPMRGWRVAAVDGHEIGCSYKRCCDECLSRHTKDNDEQCLQYYHRIVAFQLLGEDSRFLLDAELIRKREDEVAAATRMIERVLRRFPRSFDILTGDALYARAPLVKLLRRHGKHALMVLKDERRDLFMDAEALFAQQQPHIVQQGATTSQLWDIEGFTSWPQVEQPVRVVRSLESTQVQERIGKQWSSSVKTHDWIWVTTLSQGEAPTCCVVRFGHTRWQIENEGFNELVTFWHCDHYFHHHPIAILALWLILFITHAVFHCFITRNLDPSLRDAHTTIYWALQMAACFRLDHWWPPPI